MCRDNFYHLTNFDYIFVAYSIPMRRKSVNNHAHLPYIELLKSIILHALSHATLDYDEIPPKIVEFGLLLSIALISFDYLILYVRFLSNMY